jgi:predicted ATPase
MRPSPALKQTAGQRGERFFVITGATGSGKSTLLAALYIGGAFVIPEVGGALRKELIALGKLLPSAAAFMEEVLARNVRDYEAAASLSPPVFFDRGVPEVLAWARILGVGAQPHHLAAVANCRYNPTVFVTEPWREIYEADAQRQQTFERASWSYQPTIAAYEEAGYELCIVPKAPVQDRVEFVLEHVDGKA